MNPSKFNVGDLVRFWQGGTPYGANECYPEHRKSIGIVIDRRIKNPLPKGHPYWSHYEDYRVVDVQVSELGMDNKFMIAISSEPNCGFYEPGQIVEMREDTRGLDLASAVPETNK
jgi:hypothetical protein